MVIERLSTLTQHANEEPSRSPSVLIIDDDLDFLEQLKDMMVRFGFDSVTVSSAEEAREKLGQRSFDLIMTDIVMPRENGIQFLVNLHKAAEEGHVARDLPPVVVVTGFVLNELIQTKLRRFLGVELIINKPIGEKGLLNYLERRFPSLAEPAQTFQRAALTRFLMATTEVIEANTTVSPEASKAIVRAGGHAFGEFTGVIRLTSNRKIGLCAVSFERDCCEAMAHRILSDENLCITEAILRDVAGEICNQIAGHVQGQLNAEGFGFDISTPTIVSGAERIDHRLHCPSIVIPFTWEGLRFYTQFVIEDRVTK